VSQIDVGGVLEEYSRLELADALPGLPKRWSLVDSGGVAVDEVDARYPHEAIVSFWCSV
jgi:hypothetical protein